MFASIRAVLATVLLTTKAVSATQYTVWASVIFSRTGERTPEVLGYIPTTLTSYGAQQSYENGAFFRDRYISSAYSADAINRAPLQGLSADGISVLDVYVGALDQQHSLASAQAFMQGLYPPFTLNSSAATLLDPTSVLANGSYIDYPLQGYQYAQIHASGALDPDFPYLGGSLDCPGFDNAANQYSTTPEFTATQAESRNIYQKVGESVLSAVLDQGAWDYSNAYAIYDYLNYQNAHNASVAAILSQPEYTDQETNTSYLDMLRWYANEQQYAQLGNLTAVNNYTSYDDPLPDGLSGSISTIAGNMLAAKMLAQLQTAIQTGGAFYKLSLLFGDFEPFLSLFALTGLPAWNSNFYGLPDFGSVAVFELFSNTNNSMDMSFPSTDNLWVRFYFRNGTGNNDDASNEYQSYPLFNRGPSQTDMTWNDFQNSMYSILLADIGTWCTQCGATNIFCAAWNSSDGISSTPYSTAHRSHELKPAVAGAIGAVVTLAIAGAVFLLLWLIGCMSLHKREKRHKSDLGGFKGSQKLASDKDLTISKGGAVVGASVERSPDSPISPIGHERVGSWELKDAEAGRPNIADAQSMGRASAESDRVDPFRDPVKADERV